MARRLLELEKDMLISAFQKEDFLEAQKDYIEPYCSNIDPSNQDDPHVTVKVGKLVFSALWDEIQSASEQRRILVLADAGMGKTTLLLNLFAKEQKKWPGKRRRIALIPLNRNDAREQIRKIVDQRETILLLDAFDEDTSAIEDYRKRMDELMIAAADFKAIIMTCRTQFFSQESSIPHEIGIVKVAPRSTGTPTMHEWRTVYLLPFNDQQVSAFLKTAIKWTHLNELKRAKKIVAQIPELTVLPMLLTLVPKLAAAKLDARNLWDLYVFMVDQWLQRESAWISSDELMRFSKELAVDLVLGRNPRGSERIPLNELASLIRVSSELIESWKLTNRSLLNRDAVGNFKFAHRSVMEFMFIKAFIDGDDRCASVKWTDMMCDLFISWGQTTRDGCKRVGEIMAMDLRTTSLFPFIRPSVPASSIDQAWINQALSDKSSFGARSGLPSEWRSYTSRIVESNNVVRVYDFAAGLVLQFVNTVAIEDRSERDVFKLIPSHNRWRSSFDSSTWFLPQLSEFRTLIEILALSGRINELFDTREIYWLADRDETSHFLARARTNLTAPDKPAEFAHWQLVDSVTSSAGDIKFAIDVYKVDRRKAMSPQIIAIPIMTYQGEAEVMFRDDDLNGTNANWAMTFTSALSRLNLTK
jgi:hypothetical protein